MRIKDYSLRQRKHAKTKIAIMKAFIQSMEKTQFELISVRQICESIDISEGTFFNYFPQKINIIYYYVRLMTLRVIWKAQRQACEGTRLDLINAVFQGVAEEASKINITHRLVAVLGTHQGERPSENIVSDLEKKLVFPHCPGIDHIRPVLIDDFLKKCLKEAREQGELPKNTDLNDAVIFLLAILAGTLMAAPLGSVKDYKHYYTRQLQAVWKGLGAKQ